MIELRINSDLKSSLLIIIFSLIGFVSLKANNPIELHLDKPMYNPGEIMRVKGYVVDKSLLNGQDFNLVLVNSSFGEILIDIKLESSQLTSGISIELPDSVNSNAYQLRLFDNSYNKLYNTTSFLILNLDEFRNKDSKQDQDLNTALNIFLEGGGNLVAGTENTIIVKFSAPQNLRTKKTAFVKNSNGTIVGQFPLKKNGLAKIKITPQLGEHYKVSIEDGEKTFISKEIPSGSDSGIRMSIAHSNQKDIILDLLFVKKTSDQYRFQILQKDNIITDIKISDSHFIKEFKSINLPEGVLQFSVLDEAGNIVKNRLVFNQKPEKFQLTTSSNKASYKPGEMIKLTIKSASANGFSLPANVSVSVSDVNQVQDLITYKQNVWASHFSEINEFVTSSQNYFEDSLSSEWVLDDLMITLTNSISNGKKYTNSVNSPAKLSGINVTGKVITSEDVIVTGKNAKTIGVVLSIPGTINPIRYSSIDSNNRFSFEFLDFDGAKDAYLRTWPTNSEGKYQLYVDQPKPSIHGFDFSIDQLNNIALDNVIKHQLISEQVKIQYLGEESSQLALDNRKSQSTISLENADKIINLDDYVSFHNMKTVIKEIVPYVQIKKYGFKIFSTELRRTFPGNAFVLLDGIPVEDSVIMKQDPIIFQKIEVINTLRSIYQIGKLAENGIVAFYTRPGHSVEDHNVRKIKIKGYYGESDEDKSNIEKQISGVPYIPSLLYWNANLTTDDSGYSTIEFRAPDYETNITVHLEGLSSNNLYSISEKNIKISR